MEKEIYADYEIIDSHSHIFPASIAEKATVNIGKFYDLHMDNCGSSEELIKSGNKIGTSLYLVCSVATTPHQVSNINEFIAQECSKYNCFFGLGAAHPLSENIQDDIEQIKSLGLRGVKLHPDFQAFNADSPEAFKIYEIIEGSLPLLIHCGDERYEYSHPERIANIAKNFPKLKLIASHLGGYQLWDEAQSCLRGFENVRIDLCSSLAFMSPETALERIRGFGAENCFFGTDFPMWSHDTELERLMALGLSNEELKRILAGNFREFMNI
ncbi:MAG: amidohydrolase family protein [Ruminococcus sp.]|nr:amidohydrolase family protein [Ruminococcus sp.]